MSIIYNGVTLTDINFNGVSLDKVIYNGVTVFEKAPAIIREPASGEYFIVTDPYCYWLSVNEKYNVIYWNSSAPYTTNKISFTSERAQTFISNGYTYYRGSYKRTTTVRNPNSPPFKYDDYGVYRIKN